MIAPGDFQTLVHDTLVDVSQRTIVDGDIADRLIANTREQVTSAPLGAPRRTWLAPLCAAAAVVVAVIGTLAIISTHGDTSRPTITPGHSEHSAPTPTPTTSLQSVPQRSSSSAPQRSTSSAPTSQPACATRSGQFDASTLSVCPDAARVGEVVTVTGSGYCGAGRLQNLTLVFLGPTSYIGTAGGGKEVPITPTRNGFVAHFRIPASYTAGNTDGAVLDPVAPGNGYSFATYPAGGCSVPFTVRAPKAGSATAGEDAPWTAHTLIISPTSLGAVRNGMTVAQAEHAAGLTFDGRGDGADYPVFTSANAPHLYIRPGGSSSFPVCVGAQGDGTGTPTVMTAEGFRLGGTVTELKATYGNKLVYSPAPTGGGLSPRAGYVLTEPTGTLIFGIDPTNSTVNEIAGSTSPLTPSGCPG